MIDLCGQWSLPSPSPRVKSCCKILRHLLACAIGGEFIYLLHLTQWLLTRLSTRTIPVEVILSRHVWCCCTVVQFSDALAFFTICLFGFRILSFERSNRIIMSVIYLLEFWMNPNVFFIIDVWLSVVIRLTGQRPVSTESSTKTYWLIDGLWTLKISQESWSSEPQSLGRLSEMREMLSRV